MRALLVLTGMALGAVIGGCGTDSGTGATVPWQSGRALVCAVGDVGSEGDSARTLAQTIRAASPDGMLFLGDVYDEGTAAEFERNYDPLWGPLSGITEPTPGNHDWPNRHTGYYPYWRAKKGHRYPPWSKITIAGWEILNLNSQAPHDEGSRQLRWLARALQSPGDCRIAFWHRPRYSAGVVHGDQDDMDPVYRALSGHARAVVSGHDHDLQRLRRRDGLVQYVAGAGGRHRYELDPGHAGLAWGRDDIDGALRIVLAPGHATFEFTDVAGHPLDRSRSRCTRR